MTHSPTSYHRAAGFSVMKTVFLAEKVERGLTNLRQDSGDKGRQIAVSSRPARVT